FLATTSAHADYLDVSRVANMKEEPRSNSKTITSVPPPTKLRLLQTEQENGYYHVADPKSGRQGWVYRTFGRRFTGEIPHESTGTAGTSSLTGVFPLTQCKAPYNEEPTAGLSIESCGLQGDAEADSAE